jgi:hypothetical protein
MKGLLLTALAVCTGQVSAKDVMCLKTNTGQYIEVVRVSMLVIPDGGKTFEIVVRDGEGASGVESVSFETHASDIDLSKYQGSSSDNNQTIDTSKPVFLITSTGKYFYLKELPTLNAKEGSSKFDIEVGAETVSDVDYVYFYRGSEEDITGIESAKTQSNEERLTLQTQVSSQLQRSGCAAATRAAVYSANGQLMLEAPVANGATTINVEKMARGVYIVKVGRKSLKFIKR